ncbi:MAG: LysR family transcriptional regulator, glycine cleavage system transcriptional activator [Sphingomonadales bacterium]|jgi:LysR family glycine cleavage system transcriptional activator|nr:LysR family transcriptional regulator, glycine cleavage system transcriptional activator [Sphingomonadales bacterium]
MRHLPPLPSVRVFEAAARHENFTLAAGELGMTQAAVSYQIRLLEDRLGLPLFVRSKRRVTLSEAGRRLAPVVSDAFDRLGEGFSDLVDEDESMLAISTAQTFASNWLAGHLGAFQVARPELAVRLQTSNGLVDFARDEADVAIRMGEGQWPGLRRHFLFHHHFTPMCTPDFRDRHALREPHDVLRVPRLTPDDEWWELWLSAAGVALPAERIPGIRLDSQATEGQAAMAGHGLGMLTPMFWKAELAAGRLVQPFALIACERRAHWLVYPEHKRGRAKIRAFRDWLLAEIAAEAPSGPAAAFTPPSEAPAG